MFPWEKRKERFPNPVGSFESELMRLEEEFMNALREGRNFSYGFTIVSVNGQPVRQDSYRQPEVEEREPLVDVIEENGQTKVLIDLPGVEKKDIKLSADGNVLEVKVDTEGRKYHKEIELAHSAKNPNAEYKNGVLEISVKKDVSKK